MRNDTLEIPVFYNEEFYIFIENSLYLIINGPTDN